jgi:putative sporulation protein YtaF
MAHLLTILGLSVSSNLDTLGVGCAYGARRFWLPFQSNLVCALIPCVGTFLTMVLGSTIRGVISEQLGSILGAAIMVASGAALIVRYFRRPGERRTDEKPLPRNRVKGQAPLFSFLQELRRVLKDPFLVDYDYSGSLEINEALVLALALTLNNLSCGFAAGLLGLNVSLMIVLSFLISLIFFSLGIRIGLLFIARWFGEKGDLVSGIMLILIGLYEFLG